MAVTAAVVRRLDGIQFLGGKAVIADLTFDTSYPAGGYVLDWNTLLGSTIFTSIDMVLGAEGSTLTTAVGRVVKFMDSNNLTAGTAQILQSTTGAPADLIPVVTGSDQSAVGPIRVLIIGT